MPALLNAINEASPDVPLELTENMAPALVATPITPVVLPMETAPLMVPPAVGRYGPPVVTAAPLTVNTPAVVSRAFSVPSNENTMSCAVPDPRWHESIPTVPVTAPTPKDA